jgi:PPE-repeat protein
VNTVDNGRYTCHIQGLFVFAQTDTEANITAQNNLNSSVVDINLIYPDDLFQIYVRSQFVAPALAYIERTKGYASIFSSYTIIAVNFTFVISNDNGTFGKNNISNQRLINYSSVCLRFYCEQ